MHILNCTTFFLEIQNAHLKSPLDVTLRVTGHLQPANEGHCKPPITLLLLPLSLWLLI